MSSMDDSALEAAGWRRLPTTLFSAVIGQTWVSGQPGARQVALVSTDAHANDHIGVIHGGVLMTFADIALGVATSEALGLAHCVTAQLQMQFVATAAVGSLLICEPEVVRKTSSLVFARGLIQADGKVVASADGIFKVLDPAKFARMQVG